MKINLKRSHFSNALRRAIKKSYSKKQHWNAVLFLKKKKSMNSKYTRCKVTAYPQGSSHPRLGNTAVEATTRRFVPVQRRRRQAHRSLCPVPKSPSQVSAKQSEGLRDRPLLLQVLIGPSPRRLRSGRTTSTR